MKVPFPLSLIGLGYVADRASGATAFGVIAAGLIGIALLAVRPVLTASAPGGLAEAAATGR